MTKGLFLTLSAAIAVAITATPSAAATKKKPAPKPETGAVGMFHSCVNAGTRVLPPVGGPVSAVGCGVVWSVPVMFQSFLTPRKA